MNNIIVEYTINGEIIKHECFYIIDDSTGLEYCPICLNLKERSN